MPENKLISHVKDANGAIHATLVAISPKSIGIAVRRPEDSCDKKRAINIAETRAKLGKVPNLPNRKVLISSFRPNFTRQGQDGFETLSVLVEEKYYALRSRAENYFKVGKE